MLHAWPPQHEVHCLRGQRRGDVPFTQPQVLVSMTQGHALQLQTWLPACHVCMKAALGACA
jgi:hypothetical protein